MKILEAAAYFHDSHRRDFSKAPTGFGYMLKDILDAVAAQDDVYVFTHRFTDGYEDGFHVLPHDKARVIRAARPQDIFQGLKLAAVSGVGLNTALHYFYYELDAGAFARAVKEVDPDVIHIHGLTYQTKPFIDVCLKMERRFLVTLHGLNGISDKIMLPEAEKKYEAETLRLLNRLDIPVTVVSSGVRKRIADDYGIDTGNIRVILNGTTQEGPALCAASPAPAQRNGRFELLCAGTVCPRKNQTHLLDALTMLPPDVRARLHVRFAGKDPESIMRERIERLGLSDTAEYLGFVPREKMGALWEKVDANVVMSQDEGFGLTMIEGFMHGVPTLAFADLDAIEDLYCADAFELFASRTAESVCEGLCRAMNRTFDREKILAWGEKFTMKNIGLQYSKLYEEIILAV